MRDAQVCQDMVFVVLEGIIQEHIAKRGAGHTGDLLDVLLKIQKEGGLRFPLDTGVIKFLVFVSTSYLTR